MPIEIRKCPGGKLSKVYITGMAAANAVEDKIPMFVIGKVQTSCCIKNIKFLPHQYWHQKLDRWCAIWWVGARIRPKIFIGRIMALVTDNCPAHPHVKNLKSIKLFFVPPNTTSTTQPMDQDILRSLKAKYHKDIVQKIIRSLEKNNALPEVSILKAMQMLVSAWNAISTETIVNCFRKAGISTAN